MSSHYAGYLKLIQCCMSVISVQTERKMVILHNSTMIIQGKDFMDSSLFTFGKCVRVELVHYITVNFKYKKLTNVFYCSSTVFILKVTVATHFSHILFYIFKNFNNSALCLIICSVF